VRINPDLKHNDWLIDVTCGNVVGETTSAELVTGLFNSIGAGVGVTHVW